MKFTKFVLKRIENGKINAIYMATSFVVAAGYAHR